MATRSNIAVQMDDGSYLQIYCHWDGYPEHNGQILAAHYDYGVRAKELVSHGDLSILAPAIEPTGPHTFDNPEDGVCVYYGRDRLQPDVEAIRVNAPIQYEEYLYVWRDGDWWVVGGEIAALTPLKAVLAGLDA